MSADAGRFAIVVSRFNETITDGLLQGAKTTFAAEGVSGDALTVIHVPGAFEIPLVAKRLADSGQFDAVVCLGCLIKGETMHFEYIASATSQGIMSASLATGVPMAFGVLTTVTDEQAEARAMAGPDNKGREAAMAAVQMVRLLRTLPLATARP